MFRCVTTDWGLGTGYWVLGMFRCVTTDWGLGTGYWVLGMFRCVTTDWGLGTGYWVLGMFRCVTTEIHFSCFAKFCRRLTHPTGYWRGNLKMMQKIVGWVDVRKPNIFGIWYLGCFGALRRKYIFRVLQNFVAV